jgi:hypothetical protein
MLTISNLLSLVERGGPTLPMRRERYSSGFTAAQKAPPASDQPSRADNPTSALHYAKTPTTLTLQHNAIEKLFGLAQAASTLSVSGLAVFFISAI